MDASTVSSMQASPPPPAFQDIYSLSTSSLGCNALCMVISFLVLWSIYLSSSRVDLRNGPEYLTSGTAQVFIPFVTRYKIFIPGREFIFRTCEDGAARPLIPRRISSS